VPGSFRQLVENIRGMNELGMAQTLVSTPTSWNEHEIGQMWQLADELGVELRWQGPVGPRDNGDTEPLSIQPSSAAWREVARLGAERRAEKRPEAARVDTAKAGEPDRVCGLGTIAVDIDPFGNVYPCIHLKNSVGSLHEQSITEIWQGALGRAQLAAAEQLSIDAARQFQGKPLEQYGAPVYCPAVAINASKGCSSGGCAAKGCATTAKPLAAQLLPA
jgi:MoaA/NifB/PqqE/SkfB family radical SAM enzyme